MDGQQQGGQEQGGEPQGGSTTGNGPGTKQQPTPVVPATARPLPGVRFPLEAQAAQPPAGPGASGATSGAGVSPQGFPTPGPVRRRRRWLAALIVVAVVALGVAAVVVISGGDDGSDIEALGADIGNAVAAVAEAEQVARDFAEAEGAAIADDLRCWFSYPTPDATEPNSFLRCGPILFVDSDADEFWITVSVTFEAGPESTIASVGTVVETETTGLEADEELVRPDGGSPPRPDDVDLEPPPPPPADAGFIQVTEGSPLIDLEEQPEDGRLNGKSYRLEVDGFSYTDRVVLPSEDDFAGGEDQVFSAASGEQWLVAQFTVDSFAVWDQAAAEFALVVDGSRRDLGELADPFSEDTRSWVLTASVPTDADEVALVASEVELEQTWSFVDERRSDEAPEVLYRDEQSLATDVNQQFSLPFAVDDVENFSDSPFGDQQASLSIGGVELHYMVEDGNGRVHTASGSDRALMYLTDVEATLGHNAASFGGVGYTVLPQNMVAVLADGTEVTATRLSEDGSYMVGGFVVWDVPADIETATITITPGRGTNIEYTSEIIDFQDEAASFEVDFGPA